MIGLSKSRYFLVRYLNNKEDSVESYNACNMFLCKFLLYWFILVFASNNLASQSLVLRGNASHASKNLEPKPMPFVSTITTYYVVFFCHSKVNCLRATFKISFLVFAIRSSWESSLKAIVVMNMLLCILVLISCLLSGNHVSGDAINFLHLC